MKKLIYTLTTLTLITSATAQQNLGVDQPNPQAKIHITNTANQKSMIVEDEATDATPFVIDSVGNVGVKTSNPSVSLDIEATDAIGMPSGTTAQRPASANAGDMRFNSDLNNMEYYNGTKWVAIAIIPTGSMQPFGGIIAFVPNDWLLCDGSVVSRTTYADLFAVIGTNYGEGDGSTTFNLPDLRGRFLRGTDNSAGNDPDAVSRTASNAGGNSGDNVGSYQDDAFQGHKHRLENLQGSAISTSGATPGAVRSGTDFLATTIEQLSGYSSPKVADETRPKNVNVNYIIKY